MESGAGAIAFILALLVLLAAVIALYMMPTIIAYKRHKKNSPAILIINAFFGWTFLGYVVCLAWAFTTD